jgi:hypothetical protein
MRILGIQFGSSEDERATLVTVTEDSHAPGPQEQEETEPTTADILRRPLGRGFPSRAEVRAGAPSLFADHAAQGGYGKALAAWEDQRRTMGAQELETTDDETATDEDEGYEEDPEPPRRRFFGLF